MVARVKPYGNFDSLASQIKNFLKKTNLRFCELEISNSHKHGTDYNIIKPIFEGTKLHDMDRDWFSLSFKTKEEIKDLSEIKDCFDFS